MLMYSIRRFSGENIQLFIEHSPVSNAVGASSSLFQVLKKTYNRKTQNFRVYFYTIFWEKWQMMKHIQPPPRTFDMDNCEGVIGWKVEIWSGINFFLRLNIVIRKSTNSMQDYKDRVA
jgi:hypothetical protein